ncbi:MAG: site-2 protease family protein [Thermoanaerobaculia bacterium]|nr:site-2 protease family protein [Thermoanaerobaculia bacterium]
MWTSPEVLRSVWSNGELLVRGLSYSIPLLLILLCHELGHYVACRYYRLRVTPPYFLPFPLALGTLGAFIRIRSPVRNKRQLFDIGVAGPIAGFVALLPFLFVGVALSTPSALESAVSGPSGAESLLYVPGESLALRGVTWIFHGPLAEGWVLDLHPIALAAWVGLFATSLNLLPLAQLDGGHILYALVGRRQRFLAIPLWLMLLAAGWWWSGWLLWALIVLVLGLIHPPLADEGEPLDPGRRFLAFVAPILLVVCFMPIPLDLITLP